MIQGDFGSFCHVDLCMGWFWGGQHLGLPRKKQLGCNTKLVLVYRVQFVGLAGFKVGAQVRKGLVAGTRGTGLIRWKKLSGLIGLNSSNYEIRKWQ